jgi:exonuclease SbcD
VIEPIRLLHFADLHIGMENYGRIDPATGINGRVLDFLRRLDELIDYGVERDVDAVVFAGDAFKTRDPSPTYQREFARRLRRLSDANVPVVLLVGNHDLPAMEKKASSLDIYRTLNVPHVHVGWRDELFRLSTKRGLLQVACLPYPMRQRLLARDDLRGKSVEELDRALTDTVANIVRGLAAKVDPNFPAVLTGHFTVGGATFGSERSVMIGSDVVMLKSVLADPVWDYVALGHIHKYQELNSGGYPAIVYPGSLERVDFGEERDAKGFCWVDVRRGQTTYKFIKANARRFVSIYADVRDAENPTQAVLDAISAKDISDAVVRVVIKLKPHQESLLREKDITQALGQAYYISALNKAIEREARQRLGGHSPEGLTAEQLLQRYFEAKGTEPERTQQLVECAKEITTNGERNR